MTRITDAELRELLDCIAELLEELREYVNHAHPQRFQYQTQQRRWERDMQPVNRALALLEKQR